MTYFAKKILNRNNMSFNPKNYQFSTGEHHDKILTVQAPSKPIVWNYRNCSICSRIPMSIP